MKVAWPIAWPAALARHLGADRRCQIFVGASLAQDRAEVHLLGCEQAVAQSALGAEADPVTGLTERTGHARDDTDLTVAVAVREPLGRFAATLDGSIG